MRSLLRLTTLLLLAVPGLLLVGMGAASAATTVAASNAAKPGVLQAAWFWQTALEQINPPVAPPAPPPTEPSGVPKGDFAVAHTSSDSSSSKMTVLAFNLGALKPGSRIDDFTVTLIADSAGTNIGTPDVVACLPTRLWSPAAGGSAADEPPVDCTSKATPAVKGDSYTFTISALAQTWLTDQNLGVAFVNDPANTKTPFQVVFKGVKSVKAQMHVTPPFAGPTSSGSTGGGSTASGTGSSASGTSGGGSSGSSSTGGGSGTVVAPPAPVDLPPTSTGTTTPPAPAPQVAQPGTASPAQTPAAARSAPSAPPRVFWIAGAALALLIVAAAAVLADTDVPVPTATTSKLSRVLRERERSLDDPTATVTSLSLHRA